MDFNLPDYSKPILHNRKMPLPPINCDTVLGVIFDEGVIVAADTMMARGNRTYFQTERVLKLTDKTVLGFCGDYKKYLDIKKKIDYEILESRRFQPNSQMDPQKLCQWARHQYDGARTFFQPITQHMEMVIGGMVKNRNGTEAPFLGKIDPYGRLIRSNVVSTGKGVPVVSTIIRTKIENRDTKLTRMETFELINKVMEVLYYRICRASNKYYMAVCTRDGVEMHGPISVPENWKLASHVKGF